MKIDYLAWLEEHAHMINWQEGSEEWGVCCDDGEIYYGSTLKEAVDEALETSDTYFVRDSLA
jgi:hypothetical protein